MESKRRITKKEYIVIAGCNVTNGSKETRYEIGDEIPEKDLTPSQIRALTELNAIQELTDGDS